MSAFADFESTSYCYYNIFRRFSQYLLIINSRQESITTTRTFNRCFHVFFIKNRVIYCFIGDI
ncbi:hypothetical protein HMPREF1325_0129 [Treponema socranskii subsp. socranskii VPI DR56BR1116 = ATCC 35536]|uniref:Uncharacterized protein n=1 Tax=Treponema socranskii subsp. socranskii VPI DR56BR1116 = ATCC 35536 TaxID=1125725 RepID=U1GWB2_TRESO|nr:hypothetical protein HMPREF1325_0129 [Treponema socranskii subsp. socranskii VPI DR56BR1116 = ATCC 35536]